MLFSSCLSEDMVVNPMRDAESVPAVPLIRQI
jgi:hypothetical protein